MTYVLVFVILIKHMIDIITHIY